MTKLYLQHQFGISIALIGLTMSAFPVEAEGQEPEMIGPGVISTAALEYGPAFTAGGDTLYFTRRTSFREPPQIYWSVRDGNGWSEPSKVPFSSVEGDEFPSLSPDGQRLYFASKRPANGVARESNDMWFVARTAAGWSEPRHLGGELSTDDVDSHPVETEDGLYFHSRRAGGMGRVDAYFAAGSPGNWSSPVVLPFNSPQVDGEVVIRPGGGGAVFYSDRPGGHGRGDLYFAPRDGAGWGEPVNLGRVINAEGWSWTPTFLDANTLVFSRLNSAGDDSDLYRTTFSPPE